MKYILAIVASFALTLGFSTTAVAKGGGGHGGGHASGHSVSHSSSHYSHSASRNVRYVPTATPKVSSSKCDPRKDKNCKR